MAEMYNGRPLKEGVTVKEEIRDGKKVAVFQLPQGCKNPYADGKDKRSDAEARRKALAKSPEKALILGEMIEKLRTLSKDGVIYKTKASKYVIQSPTGQWFSMVLSANSKEPEEKIEYGTDLG